MEPLVIFLLLGILIIVGVFITHPFRKTSQFTQDEDNRSVLLAEQERLLTALHELDFDYSLRKVPDEDYPVKREELLRLGATVLEKIDALPTAFPEIHQHQKEGSTTPLSDEQIEELILKRRTGKIYQKNGFCPKCGKTVRLSDQYCPSCGWKLKNPG